jgi:uncharacterized protein
VTIDCHVHLAAVPTADNGCFISPAMLKGPLFRFLAWRLGLNIERPEEANAAYLDRLLSALRASRRVKGAVVLAMDGVYDGDGRLDREKTEFLISNDYVLDVVKRHKGVLRAGVSINPRRRDALEELDRCAAAGAALVKVLPNTQDFDPSEKSFLPFYRAMAKHCIPLLSHVGYEFSLWGKDQSVGDPARVRGALEEGVTVIAAHGASFGLFLYEKYWDTLLDFVRRYPNFYWDASALSLPNRARMLMKIRRRPELHARMVFGTDYPLPVFAYPALWAGKPAGYAELLRVKNPFDRHHRLLEILGLPPRDPGFFGNP